MQTRGTPTNVITGLNNLTWRNLEAPAYSVIGASGGWALAERGYPYVPAKTHLNMGREGIPMSFVLMFRNTLQRGSFPGSFNNWFEAVALDPSLDVLSHPILGAMTARVASWSLEATASKTDGVDLTVNWVESIQTPESAITIVTAGVAASEVAAAADAQMSKLGIHYPTGKRTTSLTDLIGQINGLAFSTRLTLEGYVNQALGIINSIIYTVENVLTHSAYILVGLLKKLYVGVKDIAETFHKASRPTATTVTASSDTIDSIADSVGNTAGEIATLNPSMLGKPLVPSGTTVTYYTD